MPSGPGNKRNTRLTAATSDQLSPNVALNTLSNSRISTEKPHAVSAPFSNSGRKVKVNFENGSVTLPRGSSVSTSFSLDNLRDVRSSSEMKTPPGDSVSHDQNGHQQSISEVNIGADDQQSTEPVPSDFDHNIFMLSSSPEAHPDAPVTRSKARRQALAIIDGPNSTERDIPVNPTHQTENISPRPDDKENKVPPRSNRRDPPITRAGENVRPPHADGEDSTDSPREKTEVPKFGADYDEYKLPESENDSPEESIIAEIRGRPKKIANKKPSPTAVPLSRPRGKPVVKARAAPVSTKRVSRPAANRATASTQKRPAAPSTRFPKGQGTSLDKLPPFGQSAKGPEGSNGTIELDFVPDSQDTMKRNPVAEPVARPKAKPRNSNVRRAKKPFFQDDLSEQQTKAKTTTPGDGKMNQHPAAGQGKTSSSPPKMTKLVNNGRTKRAAPNISQSQEKRQKGNNSEKLMVGKSNGGANTHDQESPIAASSNINMSPLTLSSEENFELIERGDDVTHLKNPLYHPKDETSERSDLELEKQFDKGVEAASAVKGSFRELPDQLGISTPAYLPRLVATPIYSRNLRSEATQTELPEVQPLPHRVAGGLKPEDEVAPGHITGHRFLDLPRVSGTAAFSRPGEVTTGARKEWRRPGISDSLVPVKAFRDIESMENSLHPNSRKWAQDIAARSHRKSGDSAFPRTPENAGPLTPATLREPKGEDALKERRDAVFESIRELTMSVLRHLESKEDVTDGIVKTYQQNGRKLINMLLDRQSNELRRITTAFDDKCVQLRKLFEDGARHASAIQKRVSNEDSSHFKDRAQRSEKLLETIRKAREAVASV